MNKDLILNTDVADSIQGHVGPNTKQVFETLTAVPFSHPGLRLAGYEFLLRDQFGNYYHKMRAVLFDGELYDVDQHIKPSMMMRHGGGHADHENRAAKARLKITEALMRNLRDNAAVTMGRTNVLIAQGRHKSTNPVVIETQDLTHQANALEDAIVAAKAAEGRPLKAENVPDGFVPLKAEKAAPGEKLGEVVAFPGSTPPPVVANAAGHELDAAPQQPPRSRPLDGRSKGAARPGRAKPRS